MRRPRLEGRLDQCWTARLTLLVADAGFGKSTLLAAWAQDQRAAWHTFTREDRNLARVAAGVHGALAAVGALSPEDSQALSGLFPGAEDDRSRVGAVASELSRLLTVGLDSDLVLVLDDVHELGSQSAAARLIEALVRQGPPRLHLVLSSRAEPPFATQRLRGRGEVLEITAAELAFDLAEVRALLRWALDADAEELADVLYGLTGGWPAALRLALEALRVSSPADRAAAVERLRHADGPLFAYLAEEIFGGRSRALREFVASIAPLERFSVGLCEALGLVRAAETVGLLELRGLVTQHEPGSFVLHALVRDFALECLPLADGARARLLGRAAEWLELDGQFPAALAVVDAAGDLTAVRRLLLEHGDELLRPDSVDAVLDAGGRLTTEARDTELEQLVGEAHFLRSEWDEAAACFSRAAGRAPQLPPKLACLLGRVESERGRQEAALAAFRRGRVDGSNERDEALLLAWTARPCWNLGKVQEARELAERALVAAVSADDPNALAAAHTSVALTLLGADRYQVDTHLRLALAAAEEAGDVSSAVRTRLNLTHALEPREALPEIDAALRLAEIADFGPNLAYAFHRRGEANYYLGRLEEAALDFERARVVNDRLGSALSCWNLMYLGDVARERGDLGRARAAYEESLRIASLAQEAQGLRGSQGGLALVLAGEDPGRAQELAAKAVAVGRTIEHDSAAALNAAGWVALLAGRSEEAAAFAREAELEAGRLGFVPHLAEAIELGAMCASPPEQTFRLEEAASIWRAYGNELAVARTELASARLRGDRVSVLQAKRRVRAAGVRESAAAAAGLLASLPAESPDPIAIRTLGGFAVRRDGVPVSTSEWRSRKARDLLKILVTRRGRAVPRDVLAELLWPSEPPGAVSRRLSVALSMLRAVLDPEKRFGSDHFVSADRAAIALRRGNVVIDIEDFFTDAQAGLAGNDAHLVSAEEAYTGEFLEEDPYDDWSVGLREESRATYVNVVRELARRAVSRGDFEGSIRFLLRLLERDPYDEPAHLELVVALDGAGRHGEARRCYRTYVARMAELGLEPVAYPAPRS